MFFLNQNMKTTTITPSFQATHLCTEDDWLNQVQRTAIDLDQPISLLAVGNSSGRFLHICFGTNDTLRNFIFAQAFY